MDKTGTFQQGSCYPENLETDIPEEIRETLLDNFCTIFWHSRKAQGIYYYQHMHTSFVCSDVQETYSCLSNFVLILFRRFASLLRGKISISTENSGKNIFKSCGSPIDAHQNWFVRVGLNFRIILFRNTFLFKWLQFRNSETRDMRGLKVYIF